MEEKDLQLRTRITVNLNLRRGETLLDPEDIDMNMVFPDLTGAREADSGVGRPAS